MTSIYIDTNVFLDFYQAATDRIAIFQELVSRADKVVLTEQTVREFRRNRLERLSSLKQQIEKSLNVPLFTTAVIRELPQFKDWEAARDAARQQVRLMSAQLASWMAADQSDLVLSEFNRLVARAQVLPTLPDAISRAHKRKLLGEPPTSPDKHTIGDELIWETLLAGCRDDLVIASRDRTFIGHAHLLGDEFTNATGKKLMLVTDKLSDALTAVGMPSSTIEVADRTLHVSPISKIRIPNRAIEIGICPKCGGSLEETGTEGGDGDEFWWMYCIKCGHEEFP